jgi:putative endopeptidase
MLPRGVEAVKLKTLLSGAAAAACLLPASQVLAHDASSPCLDPTCQAVALFPLAAGADGGGGVALAAAERFGTWGFDTSGMDTAAKPGDSFFEYANGKAVAGMTIPSDHTRYGAFNALTDLSEARVRAIVEGYGPSRDVTSDRGKIAAIYASFMDEGRIEALDAKPLAADLARVQAIRSRDDAARFMGRAEGGAGSSFFVGFVDLDRKRPDVNVLYVAQAGLGLPDRDYYLKPQFAGKKAKYQAYVAQQLKNAGWADPDGAAQRVVALETQIAETHWSRIENRDADKTYNPTTVAELEKSAPGFPWRVWLTAVGAGKVDTVIVRQPTAFAKLAQLFAATPVDTLRDWEAFHVVDEMSPLLSKRFADADFEFHGHEMLGQPEEKPRWKRGLAVVERSMGEAVGRDYVAAYFPPESKAKMEALVADLRTALEGRIERLDWMSPQTKTQALEKLSKFGVKIGYPKKWRDYSGLQVVAGDAYGNARRSSEFEWAYRLSKLGKPVDKDEWGMTPQTVNAYYSPTRNEIVFPAAILQPPFFDPKADMAVNYGGIGGVIGHEMTHGFDDQGRKSDGNGVLRDWWTAEDAQKFDAKRAAYGAQYDTYEPVPGVHVQGGLTMGENIADLGGVNLALDAYHASLHGKPAPVIDGFTGDQRVFLGWAQVWREKAREDYLRQQVTVDPHSPGMFRVIGPLRNTDAWYTAFDVKDGKYYLKPADRVRIW